MNREELTPKQKVKEELFQLFKKFEYQLFHTSEKQMNKDDEDKFLELREKHLEDPAFFREWMMYDRLVIFHLCGPHKSKLQGIYNNNMADYILVKHSNEDKEAYQEELKAWKEATLK